MQKLKLYLMFYIAYLEFLMLIRISLDLELEVIIEVKHQFACSIRIKSISKKFNEVSQYFPSPCMENIPI